MNLDFGLKLTQEQKLVMTMQMQLSLNVLQMSTYELLQHVNKELQENIVLECNDNDFIRERNEEINHKDLIKYLEFDNYSSKNYHVQEVNEEISPLYFVSNKTTLKDYLTEQLIESDINNKELKICKYIIANLDSKGYLECSLNIICEKLHINRELCNKCLKVVQSLEPCGVGARNLVECLLLQVDRKGLSDIHLKEIISNYLPQLAECKTTYIAKKLGISPFEVQRISDIIKTLEPKPSRGFSEGEDIGYIIPDAYIRKINNEYLIIMNDNILPKLNINKVYREVINMSDDKVAIDYVKDKINSAVFLMKSIENRKNTLYRVLQEILSFQHEYFELGDQYLKPMTIKSIANTLELHESTVSRAIRDKYIALNDGKIKKIKELFTNSLNVNNEELSTHNIKKMLKVVIDKEDKKRPLSDSTISEMLNDRGVTISRRTVAKYREEMGIKSSTQRKRL